MSLRLGLIEVLLISGICLLPLVIGLLIFLARRARERGRQ